MKKLEGEISEEEQQQLDQWAAESPANRELLAVLSDTGWMADQLAEMDAIALPEPVRPTLRVSWVRRWGWAAAILCLVAAGSLWLLRKSAENVPQVAQSPVAADVQPGQNGAILTLADGTRLSLDSSAGGEIASQGGSRLTLANGQLAYDAAAHDEEVVQFNTIAIPRGRQFRLLLPDGSKVWLNSASSIRFPVAFTGSERAVDISGEAYFEVAENSLKPFVVHIPGRGTLRVLGTHFNIKAYPDEQGVTATLLEGKLAVEANGGEKIVLNPGQQALIAGNDVNKIDKVATSAAVAWKNGLFNFDNKNLEEVMRELARWYDLEIVYEKGVPDIMFGGEMGRNEPLSNVLLGLQDANVKFRIDANRRLVVLP